MTSSTRTASTACPQLPSGNRTPDDRVWRALREPDRAGQVGSGLGDGGEVGVSCGQYGLLRSALAAYMTSST